MKRFLTVLLAATIILTLSACSSKSEASENHGHEAVHTHEDSNTDADRTSALDETSIAATQTHTTPEPSAELTRGTVNDNVYHSDTSNLTFTKPDTWEYASDAELADKIGIDKEALNADNFSEIAAGLAAVYDMEVTDRSSGVSVMVVYENMSVTSDTLMTAQEYLNTIKGAFEDTDGAEALEESAVTLSGNTYLKASFELKDDGVTKTYYLREIDNFMSYILVTVPTGADVPNIEAMFS